MKSKTYFKILIVLIFIIIVLSSYKFISLKNEAKELKEWQADDKNCYDYFSNNENLVMLDVDEVDDLCNTQSP